MKYIKFFKKSNSPPKHIIMYKKCQIKDLPPLIKELAIKRCIEATTYKTANCKTREEAEEFTVNDFEWSRTPENHTFWERIYQGDIPEEYLKLEFEIY